MILTPENIVALLMIVSLIVYVLTGGADFGGGVWDLFARGQKGEEQRRLIAKVLAPIWEANHIWLILLVVLMFVCFPKAYATIMTFLHFPTTIMLFGIVMRGSAFVFRKYDTKDDRYKRLWSWLFAIGSIITPFFLGMILGAITIEQRSLDDLFFSWLQPFPIFTGALTLVICAFLAAVYLILESKTPALQEAFRTRAIISGILLLVLTLLGTYVAYLEEPNLFYELTEGQFAIPLQILTTVMALAALLSLFTRHFLLARFFAMTQVVLLLAGWMLTQYPDLITGHLTIAEAAAPRNVLMATITVLGLGSCLLAPALFYLFRVFGRRDS